MQKVIQILLLFLSFFLLFQSLISLFHAATTFTPDFSIFYGCAKNVLHGKSVYHDTSLFTAFNYPVTTAFLYIPFTFFPYQIAQELFATINICAAVACVFLCIKILKWHIPFVLFLFITSVFLFSFPTKFTIGMGQGNLVGYACMLGSFLLWQKKKVTPSILLFVLGVLFKPILGILICFYLLKQQWKYAVFSLSGILFLCVGMPFLLNKGMEVIVYIKDIIPSLLTLTGREVYYNQGTSGFIARLFHDLLIRKIFTNALSLLFIIILWIKRKLPDAMLFSLCLIILVLVDSLSWQHHFVFLLLPFLFVIQQVKEKNSWNWLLIIVSYLLIAANIKNPLLFRTFPITLLLSHVFFGTILLLGMLLFIKNVSKQKILERSVRKSM